MAMNFNNSQDDAQQDSGGGGAEDLSAALSETTDGGFVTSQPKKQLSPGTLAIGGLLVVAAVVVYFMYVRNGPQAAKASDATSTATTTINQFLSGGGQSAEQMRQMLKDTEKVVEQFRNNDPTKTQVPTDGLKTNPFRQPFEEPKVADTGKAEEEAKRRREELVKAVQGLKLQTVISGKRKAAMINGTLYTEGQQVSGFVVERINPGSVIVRKDKSRFELKMQK